MGYEIYRSVVPDSGETLYYLYTTISMGWIYKMVPKKTIVEFFVQEGLTEEQVEKIWLTNVPPITEFGIGAIFIPKSKWMAMAEKDLS